jgi:hypothetical protein
MPFILWRYEGVLALPALYGLLMVSFSWIHEQYAPDPAGDREAWAEWEEDGA